MSTSNMTLIFGQFSFQNKQRRAELLGLYSEYFEEFKLQSPTPSRFQSLLLQPLQQQQQMAYAPIAKNVTDLWYHSLAQKPQTFNAFKLEFLRYFNNSNKETEAVTTYLRCFYRNLHQIQAIQADYFTALQILNQFIHGLCNAVTNAQDFETAKLKANHT
ncbi:hypothetical protein G9A89_006291 [Geosiphon pyriformis]|nr:hypothetical protein G9A89_006291 [Geosiphon pyriformis]